MDHHKLIAGFDKALKSMRKGSEANVIIPPSLGYMGQDLKTVPAYSTLEFNIEVIDVIKPGERDERYEEIKKEEAEKEA